jgi:hypothetical protein
LPSATQRGTWQRNFQKKTFFFAECQDGEHSAKKFSKKILC